MTRITHPALLEMENERLRELLAEYQLHIGDDEKVARAEFGDAAVDRELARRAALSQQAEPAPAQDERDAFEARMVLEAGPRAADLWIKGNPSAGYSNERVNDHRFGWVACLEWMTTRPAQAEQQPVGYANFRNGRFGNWLHPTEEGAKNFDKTALAGKPAGSTQVALYAAPIAQIAPQGLRIVFDGPPGPEAGRLVEIENSAGYSVNAGEWRERTDGLWELVLHAAAPQPEQSGLVEAVTPEIIDWVRCGLSVNGRLVDGTHPALEKLCAAYRAALSAQGASK